MHVGGDPVQIISRDKQSGDRGHELPETVERKRNLTDADKDFIAEIEDYITNLVHHVNQAYLLNELFTDHKCMSILMNNPKHRIAGFNSYLENSKSIILTSTTLNYI